METPEITPVPDYKKDKKDFEKGPEEIDPDFVSPEEPFTIQTSSDGQMSEEGFADFMSHKSDDKS